MSNSFLGRMRIVILNGVVKATQTGILSSQALVLMGPLTKVGPYRPHGLHMPRHRVAPPMPKTVKYVSGIKC